MSLYEKETAMINGIKDYLYEYIESIEPRMKEELIGLPQKIESEIEEDMLIDLVSDIKGYAKNMLEETKEKIDEAVNQEYEHADFEYKAMREMV